MKKILNALFLTLLAVFTFSSCSDVPAPYDILGEGDVPGLTGDGTKENPYSIEAAQQKQDGTIAWVQGYIVGTVENYEDPSGSAKFAAPFTAKNNLLIAASATETNVKNCVCVQLSSGTELYSKLNLAENATNLGHILAIQGSLEKFYGFPGVKSTTAATLDGKDVGGSGETDPDNPLGLDDSNPVNSFSATFDDAVNNNDYLLANWYNVAVAGGRRWQGKIFNNTDKYIQATSYNA
ncbi:sugar-binding protein, partial [Bacteroides xylanisolvens]